MMMMMMRDRAWSFLDERRACELILDEADSEELGAFLSSAAGLGRNVPIAQCTSLQEVFCNDSELGRLLSSSAGRQCRP